MAGVSTGVGVAVRVTDGRIHATTTGVEQLSTVEPTDDATEPVDVTEEHDD